MLADQLDYVVGVDPHRDTHAVAIVEVRSGGVVLEASVEANSRGYAHALELAQRYAPGRRVFAIEGTGSFGAGLTRFLVGRRERVLEVGRLRRGRSSGGKTDALDAVRAARGVLAQTRLAEPRAGGEREPLCALMAAREGAVNARRAGLCHLRDLLITTPEPLRSELRPLSRAQLLRRLAAVRPDRHRDAELRGTLQALRTVARCVQHLTSEERELAREIEKLTRTLAATRTSWRRTARSRATRDLLVAPRPDQKRSRLRTPRRLRPDPRLIRPDSPLPTRPKRRLATQPRTAHDPRHAPTNSPANDRLHQPTHTRRQEPTRSKPLPRGIPRPQPLPTPRTPANDRLTFIEASLAQAKQPPPACVAVGNRSGSCRARSSASRRHRR
jgi:Transposase